MSPGEQLTAIKESTAHLKTEHPFEPASNCSQNSKNHRFIEWPGLKRTTMTIDFQPPAMHRVANQQTRLPRATSSLALNACRDGASTACLCTANKTHLNVLNLLLPCFSICVSWNSLSRKGPQSPPSSTPCPGLTASQLRLPRAHPTLGTAKDGAPNPF